MAVAAMVIGCAPAAFAQDAKDAPVSGERVSVATAASQAADVDRSVVLIPVKDLAAAQEESRRTHSLTTSADAGKPVLLSPAPELPAVGLATAERQNRQTAAKHAQQAADAGKAEKNANDGKTADGGQAAGALAAPAPIGDQPDPTLLDECLSKDDADSGFGRVHNRFTYCNERQGAVEFYWVVNGRRIWRGTNTFTYQIFAQGDNTSRRIRMFSRVVEDSVRYNWLLNWDQWFTGRDVRLNLMANCPDDFALCHAAPSSVSLPFVVWDNNDDWYNWDVYGHDSAGVGRDLITLSRFRMEFWGEGAGAVVQRGVSPSRWMRCDSASYFSQGTTVYPKACVFNEVTPRLNYVLASDYRSVAQHIYDAQYFPNTTYPLLVPPGVPQPRDKTIPGRYDPDNANAPGLHRITELLHPGEYKANGDHKDGACYKTGPEAALYVDTGLPVRPDTPAEQCDEYPFASTLEGAANPNWDFSVRAVPQRDNSIAGGLLGSYYNDDRILAWDPALPDTLANDRFYVHIE
ncbi:NucA/NucB deoxyribonuclease domain-containing protein [Streptomyces sp. NPDC102406]|uniref:NucA/NucB deoxyribonuclease domain-containing protein n=1 Tax=Streptomyces sp. NPDC102406 TaxID=3366171 RepID=UPI0038057C3A